MFYLLIVLGFLGFFFYCYCITVPMCWYISICFLLLLHDTEKILFVYFTQTQFCAVFHQCKYWFTDGWQIKGKPGGSFMLWRSFCLHGLGTLIPLEGSVITNQYEVVLIDRLHSVIKHFYPDGCNMFQDEPTPIHSSQDCD